MLGLLIAAIGYIVSRASDRTMLYSGGSMNPVLEDGDMVRVDTKAYVEHPPQRGDVIAFDLFADDSHIKRVIGLPGEEVRIEDNRIFINEVELIEPYLESATTTGSGRWVVPANSYFVLGDNRAHSMDSRTWGLLAGDKIIGKVIEILNPADRRQFLLPVDYD